MERLALFVFRPARFGRRDVVTLALLAAAGEQDNQRLTILSEVNPIAGSEIHLQFGNTAAEPCTFERLPRASRVSATVILAWVYRSSASSQA